jgi:D-3-phosphoglycerate dehydrogenase / 2-oxoglutarate reductase
MKILVTDEVSDSALKVLRDEPSFEVVYLPAKGKKLDPKAEIKDAEALIVRSSTKVTAELLQHASSLRVIGRAGVGVDNVDLEAATRKGVVVMNTPGGNATSVAEQTVAFLLALARRIAEADDSLKQGKWEKKKFLGMELRGKTLGLIGLGRVGLEVARLAQAFQMKTVGYDPFVPARLAQEQNVQLLSLSDLLRTSDFVSLHCSLTPETQHLLNAHTLGIAKPGVRVVNCARGELINEKDLLGALESGHVAGAGLDVFEVEPPQDAALIRHPHVIATPHIAGSTEEAQEIVGIRVAEQVRDYLLQGIVRNAVNMPSVSPEEYKRLQPYVQLGERLGSFLGQVASGAVEHLRVSYDGGLAELNTHLVKNAVLVGILNQVLSADEQANLINASSLARERRIEVTELRSTRRAAFSNSLGIAVKTAAEGASVLGMVGLKNTPRLLGLNDIDIEAALHGTILYIQNQDVPGVIGAVGTVLGNHAVNIASFALGRNPQSHEAIGLINVDNPIPTAVLNEIKSVSAVRHAHVVKMG